MDDDQLYPGVVPRPETRISEYEAGPRRLIVVYEPPDTGGELDPRVIFAAVATDAAGRSGDGLDIQSLTVMPLSPLGAGHRPDGQWRRVEGRRRRGIRTPVANAPETGSARCDTVAR